MDNKQGGLLEALATSLDFERKGGEHYIQLGIDTKQHLAKNLFYNLAKQEIDHMMRIEEIFEVVRQGANWPEIPERKMSEIEEEMKKIFERLDQKAREEGLDNLKGYRLAIEFEKKGYEMYTRFSETAGSEREKRFFAALAEEEEKHLEALDNVYHFLTESEDWLTVEESKVWNWMSA